MRKSIVSKLFSYIDALRPIIYINDFDFHSIDKLINSVGQNIKIYEYNQAGGMVNFLNKKSEDTRTTLSEFLTIFDSDNHKTTYLVLKDIHTYLTDSEILAKLKSIAMKTLYSDEYGYDYDVKIFIVSPVKVIPQEIAHLITIFDIPKPKENEIAKYIENFAKENNIEISQKLIDDFSISLKGFSEFEIEQILSIAYQDNGSLNEGDKQIILDEKEQIIKKTGLLEIINAKEKIEDIGGLEHLKNYLDIKATIYKNLDDAMKFGVDIPKGILIVGMPGCGKSLTAKAASAIFEIPLLRLDLGRLLGKYVGESEANFSKAISIAEAISPCILWIDELEKAFAGITDGTGSNEVTTRLFGNFLTWLQEKDSTVFVIATSNDISKLPPEFLRKGRFDEIFFVDFPNKYERKKIFQIHLQKRKKWHRDINTIELMNMTEGFSGADIESVVKTAIEQAFVGGMFEISTEDLIEEIKDTKPISEIMKEKIGSIREKLQKMDIKPASKSVEELENETVQKKEIKKETNENVAKKNEFTQKQEKEPEKKEIKIKKNENVAKKEGFSNKTLKNTDKSQNLSDNEKIVIFKFSKTMLWILVSDKPVEILDVSGRFSVNTIEGNSPSARFAHEFKGKLLNKLYVFANNEGWIRIRYC